MRRKIMSIVLAGVMTVTMAVPVYAEDDAVASVTVPSEEAAVPSESEGKPAEEESVPAEPASIEAPAEIGDTAVVGDPSGIGDPAAGLIDEALFAPGEDAPAEADNVATDENPSYGLVVTAPAGQTVKEHASGDLKGSNAAMVVSAGDGSSVAVVAEGTLHAGDDSTVILNEFAGEISLTMWKAETGSDGYIIKQAGRNQDSESIYERSADAERLERSIHYIIKVDKGQNIGLGGTTAVTYTGDGGTTKKYDTAAEGDRVAVKLNVPKGYEFKGAFSDKERKCSLKKDSSGYYLIVPKGGGIYVNMWLVPIEEDDEGEEEETTPSGDINMPVQIPADKYLDLSVSGSFDSWREMKKAGWPYSITIPSWTDRITMTDFDKLLLVACEIEIMNNYIEELTLLPLKAGEYTFNIPIMDLYDRVADINNQHLKDGYDEDTDEIVTFVVKDGILKVYINGVLEMSILPEEEEELTPAEPQPAEPEPAQEEPVQEQPQDASNNRNPENGEYEFTNVAEMVNFYVDVRQSKIESQYYRNAGYVTAQQARASSIKAEAKKLPENSTVDRDDYITDIGDKTRIPMNIPAVTKIAETGAKNLTLKTNDQTYSISLTNLYDLLYSAGGEFVFVKTDTAFVVSAGTLTYVLQPVTPENSDEDGMTGLE